MAAPPKRTLILPLLLLTAGLAALNWWVAGMTIDVTPTSQEAFVTSPSAGGDAKPATGPLAPPLADLAQTIERPLFHPSRRPVAIAPDIPAAAPAAPAKAPPAAARPPSRLKLVGVMRSGPKSERALIKAESSPYAAWVEVGGEIAGWRVARIEHNKVRIEAGGGHEELVLHGSAP